MEHLANTAASKTLILAICHTLTNEVFAFKVIKGETLVIGSATLTSVRDWPMGALVMRYCRKVLRAGRLLFLLCGLFAWMIIPQWFLRPF